MTSLYSCRHSGDQYRITKMTHNLDVESSYLCSLEACECPAGEKRGRCRHMEMLPKFIARGAINTGWHFDYDRGGWVDNRTPEELEAARPTVDGSEGGYLEQAVNETQEPLSVAASTGDFDSPSTGSNPVGVATAPAKSKPERRF